MTPLLHKNFKLLILVFLLSSSVQGVLAEEQFILEMPNATDKTDKVVPDNNSEIIMNKGEDDVLFVQQEAPKPPPPNYSDSFTVLVQTHNPDYQRIEEKLKNGQNINQPLIDGYTMLHLAAMHGDIQLVNLALQYKANLKSMTKTGDTPLQWATTSNNIDIVKLLLDSSRDPGGDINYKNKDLRTALHFAVLYGAKPEMIEFLISHKADMTSQDNEGETPIHYAAILRNWDQLETLLKHGGNLQISDQTGDTPEKFLLTKGDFKAMIRFYSYLSPEGKKIVKNKVGSDYTIHLPN